MDAVDEMDPLERMRRRFGLDAAAAATEQHRSKSAPPIPIPSLEEELKKVQSTINIKEFDYIPVPRTEDEDG